MIRYVRFILYMRVFLTAIFILIHRKNTIFSIFRRNERNSKSRKACSVRKRIQMSGRIIQIVFSSTSYSLETPVCYVWMFRWLNQAQLWFHNLNFFESHSNDATVLRNERTSTRVYIILVIGCLLTFAVYNVFHLKTTSITVITPELTKYDHLESIYKASLRCPCTRVSVPYGRLTTISASFHQICSSQFIEPIWLDFLFTEFGNWTPFIRYDFRIRSFAYFDLLAALCDLSRTTINNNVNKFLNSMFISNELLSRRRFAETINATIFDFRSATTDRFARAFHLVRDVNHVNAYVSGYETNWYWRVRQARPFATIPMQSHLYSGPESTFCACSTRSDCSISAAIYSSTNSVPTFMVPGFVLGCTPLDSLFQSTLECFFNQTCIDLLQYYYRMTDNYFVDLLTVNVSAMNTAQTSRFMPNTSVADIVDALFVENWTTTMSYETFYNACQPVYCVYSRVQRNDFFHIVTFILELYTGLTTVLRFIVPLTLQFLCKVKQRFRNRNTVITLQENNILGGP